MSESEYVDCPYCGTPVLKHTLYEHTRVCRGLVKRQLLVPPGYVEGEVPEPAKSLLRSMGSFLTEAEVQ